MRDLILGFLAGVSCTAIGLAFAPAHVIATPAPPPLKTFYVFGGITPVGPRNDCRDAPLMGQGTDRVDALGHMGFSVIAGSDFEPQWPALARMCRESQGVWWGDKK